MPQVTVHQDVLVVVPVVHSAMDERFSLDQLAAFQDKVYEQGRIHYREFGWRTTTSPYEIWISEVMLQQTQTSRVEGRWQHWMSRFPSVEHLAAAETSEVLLEWQGLGYNRRALAVHRAAQAIAELPAFPSETKELVALPGIGPATAGGIRAFAFNLPAIYLETNVRSVLIHELFDPSEVVSDKVLNQILERVCPADASNPERTPRVWYYALLDYGAYLKKVIPNPSRRSKSYTRQSTFKGSHRQKRAALLRLLMESSSTSLTQIPQQTAPKTPEELLYLLETKERVVEAGELKVDDVKEILEELRREGFCQECHGLWHV